MPIFCWNEWNVGHIAEHGEGKYLVCGQSRDGRYLQVIFILPEDEDVDTDALDPRTCWRSRTGRRSFT